MDVLVWDVLQDKRLHSLWGCTVSFECDPRAASMVLEALASLIRPSLQDVCIELDTGDATALPTATRKLMRVVSAVPRMEAFIGEVGRPMPGGVSIHALGSAA